VSGADEFRMQYFHRRTDWIPSLIPGRGGRGYASAYGLPCGGNT
jgi:hypothetical protein